MRSEQKREYYRTYMRDRRHEHRNRLIAYLGGCCVDCGTSDRLEFDHKDPSTKRFTVSDILARAWEVVLDEGCKCELRCSPCHITKTFTNGDNGKVFATHGTHAMYRHHKCRCDLCKKAHNDVVKAHRAKYGRKKYPKSVMHQ